LDLNTIAQEPSQEVNYQNAVNLFESTAPGDAEKACDILNQLVKETPANQTYQTARRTFCGQVQLILDTEKNYADEGVHLAKNGKCVEARADYDKITRLGTRDPRYREQLKAEVNACENRQQSQRVDQAGRGGIDEATHLFQRGKDAEARARLQQLIASGSGFAQQAKELLAQIDQAEVTDRSLLNQARTLAAQKKNLEAQDLLRKVIGRGGPQSAEARQFLAQISNTSEEVLRAGLKAYFRGDLGEADDDLTSYLSKTGAHIALAYFFRGATRGSRYFLSGETDIQQKSDALEDFKILKERYGSFRPPRTYVSPKIIDLYSGQQTNRPL
jgi:hypothetical protein